METEQQQSLRERVSSPGYGARVLSVIEQIPDAEDPARILDLLYAGKQVLGADDAVFASFLRNDDSHEHFRFVVACHPKWCFSYQKNAWYTSDPWLLYALTNSEPICASQIELRTGKQHEIHRMAIEHGMVSAMVVPAPSSGRVSRVGVLVLGSKRVGFYEGDGFAPFKVLARSMAMELHSWWVKDVRREIVESCRLTDEDLCLLAYERRGQSTKQVAAELGLTAASIDSRWQRLNKKLGMPGRQASARFAAEFGLI